MDGHLSCGSERTTLGILFTDDDSSSSLTKDSFLSVAKVFSSLSLPFSISHLLSKGRADAPPISIGGTISPYNLGSAMWQLQARKTLAEAYYLTLTLSPEQESTVVFMVTIYRVMVYLHLSFYPIYFIAVSLILGLELELGFMVGVQGFMIRVRIRARLRLGFNAIGFKVRVSRFRARA